MNGSFRSTPTVLGSIALALLAVACSRQTPPPQQAPSPGFESNVPGEATPPPMGTTPAGAEPGAPTPGAQPPAPPERMPGMPSPEGEGHATPSGMPGGEPAQPGPMGAGPMGAPPTGAEPQPAPSMPEPQKEQTNIAREQALVAMANELCESLTRESTMRVEDVQGGVAVVLTPKSKENMEAVRDDARRFQQSFTTLAAPGHAPAPGGSQCALADLTKGGAIASVSEGPKAVRILVTSAEPAEVKMIRHDLREFAKANGGAAPGGKGTGGQKRPAGGGKKP